MFAFVFTEFQRKLITKAQILNAFKGMKITHKVCFDTAVHSGV